MNKEIQLTFNSDMRIRSWGENSTVKLMIDACKKYGFEPRTVHSSEMYREKTIPFAAINLAGQANETHIRYLKKLELQGTKVLNPIHKSIIADDKAMSNMIMDSLGLPVPKTVDLHLGTRDTRIIKYIADEIGFPCVIKTTKSAYGVGVHLVKSRKEFEDLFDLLYTTSMRFMDFHNTVNLIVQEFIADTVHHGMRPVVLGDKILGTTLEYNPAETGWNIKRVEWNPAYPETHSNIDVIYKQHDVDPEVAQNCIRLCKELGVSFAGIDIHLTKGPNKYIYGEVNCFPGLTNFHNCYPDVKVAEKLIEFLIEK